MLISPMTCHNSGGTPGAASMVVTLFDLSPILTLTWYVNLSVDEADLEALRANLLQPDQIRS